MSRDLINVNDNNLHHKALEAHQRKNDKGKDTQKDPAIFITGTTVAVPLVDGGLWTYGVIVKLNNDYHKGCSYTTQLTKTSKLIMWSYKHICSTNIMSEEYLCKQIKKSSGRLEDIFTQAISREMHYPHKQHSMKTTREMVMSQSSLSPNGKERAEESHMACNVTDKVKFGRKK